MWTLRWGVRRIMIHSVLGVTSGNQQHSPRHLHHGKGNATCYKLMQSLIRWTNFI